ncbi:NUDIX domain-containing protein [Niveispirillum sp. SYP-B3756]|uniref:NUDIX hydrolase n=1 Tax=Niveispirillum sp. SYP-B3756 TaxID=2662178 RepID=UPI001291A1EE|nr:NUDIX hydrolase [Niveispirillum sp. SYP-B3756]MQP66218.1 NUDIX domain-containing protein [Niveispirillum sp. SYP-B3756]
MAQTKTSQCAALPYRLTDGRPEVLLVTSRETKRWIIPKGWAKKSMGACAMAEREAFEEAGIKGRIDCAPVGSYRYEKRLDNGDSVECDVAVFLLRVTEMLDVWPEKGQRERRWMDPAEAAELVSDDQLAPMLRRLEKTLAGGKRAAARC